VKKNIYHIAVRVLLIVVMSLTSTGFTTVLGYCSMTKSSTCCCDSEHSGKATTHSNAQTIESPDFSCYSLRIAGGLNDIGGIISDNVALKASLAVVEAITPVFQNTLTIDAASLLLPLDFRDVSPPKSDICILVRSLLI
jgi:hypothetical protein